jgi:uncharacterized membrane protein
MVRFWGVFAAIIICCSVLSGFNKVFADDAQNFTFDSFDANYLLSQAPDKSSKMLVNEVLVAQFPSNDQNHGILRAIPERNQNHTLGLQILSVTDENGTAYPYTTSEQNDNKVLKIGNPDVYVHGAVTYSISYTYKDVISFYPDHDELFWNINGNQWYQPFGAVSATFHIPDNLAKSLNSNQVCFVGSRSDSTQPICNITRAPGDNETVVTATASKVNTLTSMSVALSFKPGTFVLSPAVAHEKLVRKYEIIAGIAIGILLPLVAFVILFRRWRQFGNDPKGRGVIIPQYEPPKGFDPLNSDYLYKEQLRQTAVSATLIDLAIKGFVTIYEIPKKGIFGHKQYEIKLNNPPKGVSDVATDCMKIIFGASLTPGTTINLDDFKKDTAKRREAFKAFKDLEKSLSAGLFSKGYFKKDPREIKTKYTGFGIGGLLLIVIFGGMFFESNSPPVIGFGVGLAVTALIIMVFSFIMTARTDAGVEAYDVLLGLKDYIKLAEADRLKYLQSPEGAEKISEPDEFNPKNPAQKVKLFEELLPYAMIFGLEKDWAKQFNDIYSSPPDWFVGNWTAFNTGYLVGSLSGFSAASGVSFATSSSSGGSGFAGGVSGGGGGGGGGW